ncbi:MAG: cytochrome c [Woeseiaceae bacterium]|nr:cytochrome c [Woeseiaceae bacterium]
MKARYTVLAAIAAIGTMTAAFADEHPFAAEIKARQSLMQVYRFNLGLLGSMAKGDREYDAELASAAAGNLLAISGMKNGAMWPAGSSEDGEGLAEHTAAKAENWSNYPLVMEKMEAMRAALETMAAEAGNGLDAVRANIGAVGNGCKGCHEDFRASRD